ncbi:MAG TPA: hypothetical protein VF573_18690 [Paraburkholderia sp.]|uniref:hypothetical protein n=1 Tax=Paraburkholderia sp. TaxID=1926495 RepID=UPI002ED3D5E6
MNTGDNAASIPAVVPEVQEGQSVENRRANYNRLVRTARLGSIVLEDVKFKVFPEALGVNKSLLKRDLGVTTKLMSSGIADGTCVGNIVWTVQYKFQKRTIIKCTASYIISYDGVEDCSEDIVAIFVDNVGKVATYAYLRALYAHLDWSANLGSPPLPIVQFLPKL